jgi:hypothetical protein
MSKFQVTPALIGKYINQVLWSDVNPVGKIIGIKGKTKVIIQPVEAGPNKAKMEFIPGGFAGHCYNQSEQEYDFVEVGEPFEAPISNSSLRGRMWRIGDSPRKYYDYNF